MSVVKVDSQRRIYIPKELGFKAEKALILPYGSNFLLIPIRKDVIEIDIDASIEELKKRSEEAAKHDALRRAKRRRQVR